MDYQTVSCPARSHNRLSLRVAIAVAGKLPERGESYRERRRDPETLRRLSRRRNSPHRIAFASASAGDSLNDSIGLLVAVNGLRSQAGRSLLTYGAELSASAQTWAQRIAGMDSLSHGDFAGRIVTVVPNRAAGEDIGVAGTPEQVASLWAQDGPHRRILMEDFTMLGTGRAVSSSGRAYFVADFVKV